MKYMLHLTTVEKDTYNLLQKLNTIPFIRNKFALAGGTSLSLQIGHRISIDLDFFSPLQFNIEELETILSSSEDLSYKFIGKNSRMLFCYINDVKCDFVQEPAILLKPFFELDKIIYFSVEDIAAMKMHTICGRGKRKDFFDLYALLELYTWDSLTKLFKEKYNEDQFYILWKSLQYFIDADDDPIIRGIKPFNKNWEQIKKIILQKCV
jgi:predicted nucleotidyltransferase component of viral defense system